MLPKPDSCKGCVFYGDGRGFVPDEIRENSPVLVVGQNPGSHEEEEGHPFVGDTGQLMESKFLPLAGFTRDQISIGNALRCRHKHINDLPPLDYSSTRDAIAHCYRAHFKLPSGTKLIVTQGEYALYAMTQHGVSRYDKVGDWRGYVLPFEPVGTNRTFISHIWTPGPNLPIPVLSSYHLAYLMRDPTATLVTKRDWSKIPKILRGEWPRPMTKIQDDPPPVWPAQSAFDTEFVPNTKHLLCYSMCDGENLYVVESNRGYVQKVRTPKESKVPTRVMLEMLELNKPSFQATVSNLSETSEALHSSSERQTSVDATSDAQEVLSTVASRVREQAENTSSTWYDDARVRGTNSESRQQVRNLWIVVNGQVYPASLRSLSPDGQGPWVIMFTMQYGSRSIQRQFGPFEKCDLLPIKVIGQNIAADIEYLGQILEDGTLVEIEDIMHAHAVLWSDFDHDLNFIGSLYTSINRWKHLDKINNRMYSAGDAYGTWEAHVALWNEFKRDPVSFNVYRNYQLPLVPIIMVAEEHGAKVNQDRATAAYEKRQEIMKRFIDQAQAVAGWPINLRSNDQVKHQIYNIEGLLKLLGGK